MMVTFPIALVAATLGGDILYWLTADPFFSRVSLWTSGWGFAMGVLAGVAGTAELLAGRGIRRRPESWTHAVAAMMLLATIATNWGIRLMGAEAAILPWGMLLSLGGLIFVGLAGWQGGKLVFEHQIGVMIGEEEVREDRAPSSKPASAR